MRRGWGVKHALTLGALTVLVGVVALAAPSSGSWTFSMKWELNPFQVNKLESVLTLGSTIGTWDVNSVAVLDLDGLANVFFDASGALGTFAVRSILDFDAAPPQFRTWLVSTATAIAGVNLYALFMLDELNPSGPSAIGSGLTVGGWWRTPTLSVWFEAYSNMPGTVDYIYRYGYTWLLDHFIFYQCDRWYKPSTYLDVQTSSSALSWSGATIYIGMPLTCFDLLIAASFTKADGFNYVLFEMSNLDLDLGGLPFTIKWVDVMFTVTSKSVNVVFDVSLADTACIRPFFALEGAGTEIQGIGLKALLLECSLNGVTIRSGHMFDEDGWYPYLNYLGTRVYGWTWEGGLATTPACAVTEGYDEFIGILVDGAACCGGSYLFSAFAWFDTGSSSGIFDWVETRINLRVDLGPSADVSFGLSVTTSGVNWIGLGFTVRW